MVQDGQEELAKELNLSPDDIFNLLDINQDGQLQLHEVYVSLHHATFSSFLVQRYLILYLPLCFQQILTHSRVRDGIWLTPENLREIYAGLKADKDGNGKKSTWF